MAMFERSFGVSLKRSMDEVGGGSPGMDTGIAGGGGGSPGTIGTDTGTTGAGMAGAIGTETTGCTRTGAVVEDCVNTYQEVWLKNGNFRTAAGDLSNYNQSNLAATIILTCYISLIKGFTVAVFFSLL